MKTGNRLLVYSLKKGRNRSDAGEDNKNVTWLVFKNNKLEIEASKFLDLWGINSSETSRTYGRVLVAFFNYLNTLGKSYQDAGKKDIYAYILHLAKPKNLKDRKRNVTIKSYVSIISMFYSWLVEENYEIETPIPKMKSNNKYSRNKNSFLNGQVWDFDDHLNKKLFPQLKDKAVRSHKRWYTQNEVEILAQSFKKKRDKVIFLISIELGCRIDEILSIREVDYDANNQSIYIRDSKTIPRILYVSEELCNEINIYIQTERRDVETGIGILDYLFVNLRKDQFYGRRMDPKNYLKLLKKTAANAGFDPDKIITHAGRSTKVQNLIELQVYEANSGISDAFIMEIMGWSSSDTINSYKKHDNLKIQKAISDKLKKRKRYDGT